MRRSQSEEKSRRCPGRVDRRRGVVGVAGSAVVVVIEVVEVDRVKTMAGVGDAACVKAGVMSKGMSEVVTFF